MKSTIVYGLFACSIMIGACEKQDKADSPNTLNSGLIAYYKFSGNTNDESGNGYHLVNNGASPRQDRFGSSNGAYFFNGIDNTMTVPKLAKGDSLTSFTVSVWINPEDSSSTFWSMKVDDINIQNHNMSYGYPGGFFYNTNYIAECQYLPLSSTCQGYSNSQKIDTLVNRWSHIVFWKDKDKMTSFFNGKKNYVSQSPKNIIVSLNHGGLIGSGFGYSPTGSYKGSVDDIRIYDRALTDEEIQKLFEEKP